MTNLDSVLERTDVTLQTKVHIVKAMVFPVITEFESWTAKAEHQRTDALELWCWRRLLLWEIPWTEETGRLQPTESLRVRHHLTTKQQQQGEI